MLEMKRMQESRVLEICTHGLTRGAEENSAPTLEPVPKQKTLQTRRGTGALWY